MLPPTLAPTIVESWNTLSPTLLPKHMNDGMGISWVPGFDEVVSMETTQFQQIKNVHGLISLNVKV